MNTPKNMRQLQVAQFELEKYDDDTRTPFSKFTRVAIGQIRANWPAAENTRKLRANQIAVTS